MRALSPLLTARWALEAGFMARAAALYRARFLGQGPLADEDDAEPQKPSYKVYDGVAVIGATGPLFRHASGLRALCGPLASYHMLHEQLELAVRDPQARAILLRLDSPGGEVGGCQPLAADIRAVSERKPVVAFADEMTCSAAYWLASQARRIICGPAAILGSIGVRCTLMDDSGAQEKLGLREIEIVSSRAPNKRGTPIDEDVRARIQAELDALEDVFVRQVAAGRGVSVEKVLADYGAGGVLVGQAAVDAGLADALGTYGDALAAARQLAQGATKITPGALSARTPTRSKSMSKDLAARLEALAAHEALLGNPESIREDLRGMASEARALQDALHGAKTEAVNASAKLEQVEYSALLREAQEPQRDASGRAVAGPKIAGPAQLARVREMFTTTADLKKYLAVTEPAPLTVAQQGLQPQADADAHKDPLAAAQISKIEKHMDRTSRGGIG